MNQDIRILEDKMNQQQALVNCVTPQEEHQLSIERKGINLVFFCLLALLLLVIAFRDKELLKNFFQLSSSAVLLILGYLFGARKRS